MKRFFQIIDQSTKRPIPNTYFESKKDAKKARAVLNDDHEEHEHMRFFVAPGPDHHNFKG